MVIPHSGQQSSSSSSKCPQPTIILLFLLYPLRGQREQTLALLEKQETNLSLICSLPRLQQGQISGLKRGWIAFPTHISPLCCVLFNCIFKLYFTTVFQCWIAFPTDISPKCRRIAPWLDPDIFLSLTLPQRRRRRCNQRRLIEFVPAKVSMSKHFLTESTKHSGTPTMTPLEAMFMMNQSTTGGTPRRGVGWGLRPNMETYFLKHSTPHYTAHRTLLTLPNIQYFLLEPSKTFGHQMAPPNK